MTSLLGAFRSAASKVRADLDEIHKKLDSARARRQELLTAPLPAGDLKDMLSEILDRRAAVYEESLCRRLDHFAKNPGMDTTGAAAASAGLVFEGGTYISSGVAEGVFAYYFKDQVLAKLSAAASRTYKKTGAPRAERISLLEKLDAEIAELERQDKEIQVELSEVRREAANGR